VSEPLPLFPLDMVLFPGVVLPLHIFEDRYRSLVHDLLALPPGRDREFGIVAIRAGYELGERGVHTIQRVGCTALVTEVTANTDGTFELVVIGRRRFCVEDLETSQNYLQAAVSWLGDADAERSGDLESLAARALGLFGTYRALVTDLRGDDILEGEPPTDPVDLSYTVAAAMVLSLGDRQALLECVDVASRLRSGIALLRRENSAIQALPSLPASQLVANPWSPS
jgi:Lon protease-like protein